MKKLKPKKRKFLKVKGLEDQLVEGGASKTSGVARATRTTEVVYTDDDIRRVLSQHAQETHGVTVSEGEWQLETDNDSHILTRKKGEIVVADSMVTLVSLDENGQPRRIVVGT